MNGSKICWLQSHQHWVWRKNCKRFFFFSNSALLEPPKEAQWETKEGAVYILRSLGNYFAVVDILKWRPTTLLPRYSIHKKKGKCGEEMDKLTYACHDVSHFSHRLWTLLIRLSHGGYRKVSMGTWPMLSHQCICALKYLWHILISYTASLVLFCESCFLFSFLFLKLEISLICYTLQREPPSSWLHAFYLHFLHPSEVEHMWHTAMCRWHILSFSTDWNCA